MDVLERAAEEDIWSLNACFTSIVNEGLWWFLDVLPDFDRNLRASLDEYLKAHLSDRNYSWLIKKKILGAGQRLTEMVSNESEGSD